jgi:hypothetical protein
MEAHPFAMCVVNDLAALAAFVEFRAAVPIEVFIVFFFSACDADFHVYRRCRSDKTAKASVPGVTGMRSSP